MEIDYPFKPKSTASMKPGQFWAVQMESGQFCCGRVIELMPKSRVSFLGALMDWIGDTPPQAEDLRGRGCLDYGRMHIMTITKTGWNGLILGHRDLELDGIEIPIFRDCVLPPYSLLKGYTLIKGAHFTEDSRKYPVITTWGFEAILGTARKYFNKKDGN